LRSVTNPRVLNQLVQRLAALGPDTPRRWGTLTAGEMLCHLADAARSVLSRPGGERPPSRALRKWLGLYTAIPWPHGVKTPRSVDPRLDGTRPADFEADRSRAIAGLRALAAASPADFPSGHLHFGPMTPRDWQRWAYRHTDHHLRQFGL
jgi:hypothetical protein